MSSNSEKRTLVLGCATLIVGFIPWYFIAPWQVASILAVTTSFVLLFAGAIIGEFLKARLKNRTRTSNISQAQHSQYTKFVASFKNPTKSKTWFTGETADYRWLSFQKPYRVESTDTDGTVTHRSGWNLFYDKESNLKTMEVTDGVGSCLVALHNIQFLLKEKIKTYNTTELLEALKEKEIYDVPVDRLKEEESIKVTELWVPEGQSVTFYGVFNRLSVDALPTQIIKGAEKNKMSGSSETVRERDRERRLTKEDWKQLIEQAQKDGKSTLDVLTANYSHNLSKEYIMSLGDARLNFTNILIYLAILLFAAFIGLGLVNSLFPEFVQEFLQHFND